MQPPFLELSYFVGPERKDAAMRVIASLGAQARPDDAFRIIGLPGRPEQAVASCGVVTVRTEGVDFCGPNRDDVRRLRELGAQVYAAFIRVAEAIDCLYGAILVEYSLEEPGELRRDPRSLAFRNFYLGRRLGPRTRAGVLKLLPQTAYALELDGGLYVSTSAELNPDGRSIDSEDGQYLSTRIGRVIAGLSRSSASS